MQRGYIKADIRKQKLNKEQDIYTEQIPEERELEDISSLLTKRLTFQNNSDNPTKIKCRENSKFIDNSRIFLTFSRLKLESEKESIDSPIKPTRLRDDVLKQNINEDCRVIEVREINYLDDLDQKSQLMKSERRRKQINKLKMKKKIYKV